MISKRTHIITAPDGSFHNVPVINRAAFKELQENRVKTSTSTAGPREQEKIGGTRTGRTGRPKGSGGPGEQGRIGGTRTGRTGGP